MEIKLIAFGIAKDILGSSESTLDVEDGISIGKLKGKLLEQFPEFQKLQSLRFAINEDYQDDTFTLKMNDEVVIIPPVSGG